MGDYYIPNLALPKEHRPIGKRGRLQPEYLREHYPVIFNQLYLDGTLWTYLADLNEQAQSRLECIIDQMKAADGVTEDSKAHDRMAWVQAINSIRSRAEEVIPSELIYE